MVSLKWSSLFLAGMDAPPRGEGEPGKFVEKNIPNFKFNSRVPQKSKATENQTNRQERIKISFAVTYDFNQLIYAVYHIVYIVF